MHKTLFIDRSFPSEKARALGYERSGSFGTLYQGISALYQEHLVNTSLLLDNMGFAHTTTFAVWCIPPTEGENTWNLTPRGACAPHRFFDYR